MNDLITSTGIILEDALDEIVEAQAHLEDLRNLYRRMKDNPAYREHENYVFMMKLISKVGEELAVDIERLIWEWLDGKPLDAFK